ncbi:MAG: glycosyltransferase family 2 protein [Enterobacterales bacterium]|nr:glycosyltransferase family 2 protein [Enterobacterales bacterium]
MEQTPNDSKALSIIIVNYHSWEKLRNCLESLAPENQPTINLEIIVVDNDPYDQQMNEFCDLYPNVQFVKNEGNYGFAHGCNTGSLLANGSVYLFLNPDTVVPEGVIEKMLTSFKTLGKHDVLSTNKNTKRGKFERTQRFFPKLGLQSGLGKAFHRLLNNKTLNEAFSQDKDIVYPDWVSGSVVMIGRETFNKLHGWDTQFWMYSEDADLCKRASLLGGKIAINQHLNILHDHGASSRINQTVSALTKSEVKISHHVFISKHFKGLKRILMHAELIVIDTISTTFYLLLSLIFFTSSKLKIKRLLWLNLIKYYMFCVRSRQWLSPRSIGKDSRI